MQTTSTLSTRRGDKVKHLHCRRSRRGREASQAPTPGVPTEVSKHQSTISRHVGHIVPRNCSQERSAYSCAIRVWTVPLRLLNTPLRMKNAAIRTQNTKSWSTIIKARCKASGQRDRHEARTQVILTAGFTCNRPYICV